jgi:MFS family permease
VLCVVFLVGGGIWFISSPELGRVRIPRSKRAFGSVMTKPAVLLVTISGITLVGSFAAVEAGVVASFGHGDPGSGIVLALFAAGSLIGGLAFGHLPISPWTLARRAVIILIGFGIASLWLNVWWLSVALFIAGVGIAPVLAAMFSVVSASVKFSDTAEAYGWVGTGQLIGAALGSAIAGFLIDANGAIGAFWAAIGLAVLTVTITVLFHRHVPDLRGREVGPQADTEPVATQPS